MLTFKGNVCLNVILTYLHKPQRPTAVNQRGFGSDGNITKRETYRNRRR